MMATEKVIAVGAKEVLCFTLKYKILIEDTQSADV